jgi:hypothetical protein
MTSKTTIARLAILSIFLLHSGLATAYASTYSLPTLPASGAETVSDSNSSGNLPRSQIPEPEKIKMLLIGIPTMFWARRPGRGPGALN